MKLPTIALIFALSTTSISAFAEGSTHHSGQASKHSVLAVGEGAISTTKVASTVVAVPVIAAGSVVLSAGAASVHTGASIAEAASHPHHHHRPLVITETTITADPAPNKVIAVQKKQTVIHQH